MKPWTFGRSALETSQAQTSSTAFGENIAFMSYCGIFTGCGAPPGVREGLLFLFHSGFLTNCLVSSLGAVILDVPGANGRGADGGGGDRAYGASSRLSSPGDQTTVCTMVSDENSGSALDVKGSSTFGCAGRVVDTPGPHRPLPLEVDWPLNGNNDDGDNENDGDNNNNNGNTGANVSAVAAVGIAGNSCNNSNNSKGSGGRGGGSGSEDVRPRGDDSLMRAADGDAGKDGSAGSRSCSQTPCGTQTRMVSTVTSLSYQIVRSHS